ncbi:hypothetical protein GOBAR_AA13935 [Gossypium barbadense]|uniref:TPX2 C-terminal domain-containing protein n=1 Tax=Gossypium barbadense TaxID=3634 RepID=A0A2P5XTS7_GOSBA|nr:hypothetical protein GOBAR_AA13935 [Gossypium barbadense]
MEVAKHSKQGTPVKDSGGNSGSKTRKFSKLSENSNPNISATKSSKSQKYSSKDPVVYSPRNKLRERKFVVARKKLKKERSDDSNPNVGIDCKCKEKSSGNSKKCLVPESGKVMNLVKAFERLLTTPNSKESEDRKFVLTAENLGLDRRFSASSSSSDSSSQGSVSSRASNGGRRSQRNSSESLGTTGGRRGTKQDKPTSQKPFKLRTEQRGKMKEGEFMKKIQEMMVEEEKQRIPIAQGLPWTTDEPEVLIKPHVKENTRAVDPRLHSEIRASERSEFDLQVADKMILIKHYKMERERRDKMAEEEEIKKLRKELVPKAQPMPVFDRPFLPTRSSKNPTMAREPKFHMPQHKKTKFCI